MTKEDYLKIREKEAIPLSLFYYYYIDRNLNPTMRLEEFEVYFPQFLQYQAIETKNGIKYINFNSIVNKVYNYFNQKFEL